MTIGIDYDGTFNADPELWRGFIIHAASRGHNCVCVTGRSDEGEYGAEVRRAIGDLMPIVFAGMVWKSKAAEGAGFYVNVWIDDNPEYVGPQTLLLSQYKVNE